MTWLANLPTGDTDWDRVGSLRPDAFAAIARLVGAAYQEVDPGLLELCRLRIASLLRNDAEFDRRSDRAGLAPAKVDDLAMWPSSPLFSDVERACLGLAEQFIIDANGVTQDQVDAVLGHLGPSGCYAFAQALSALEAFQRACLTLGIHTAPDVDDLISAAGRQP